MTLLVLGISHHSAPLDVLDALALDAERADLLRRSAAERDFVNSAVVLSTCNRLEIIADVTSFHGGLADLGTALVDVSGIPWSELFSHTYVHFDDKAQEHLFLLAAGLDSMALGETQILGQLRASLHEGERGGSVGGGLSEALQSALEVGKRVHSETKLSSVSLSLLDTALAEAEGHVGDLAGANALVVGAGAMSGLTVKTLKDHGLKRIRVINRTLDKAQRLAQSVDGEAVELTQENLVREIAQADVIVSVTGARGIVLDEDTVIASLQQDLDQKLNKFFIDLALPYDIAVEVGELPHIRVLNLDGISRLIASNEHAQSESVLSVIAEARALIEQAMVDDAARRAARRVSPTVTALREQAIMIVDAEFERLKNKLGASVSDAAIAEISKTLHRTADKIIHTPTVKVKELASADSGVDYAAALNMLFDLSARTREPETDRRASKVGSVAQTEEGGSGHIEADGTTPVADHTLDVVEPEHFTGRTIRLGTRRSQLARSQSTAIAQQLAARTGWRIEIVEVVTEGDVNMTPLARLGGSGVFVSSVRTALLTGKVDIAVHSLKDLPTAPAAGIEMAAVPPRVDPSDVLIARNGLSLVELPPGSVVGTGSPRRASQLRAARPDITVTGVRGNVGTRINHVTEGRLDGVVLAAAGVRRLGRLGEVTDFLDSSVMLPAPGQGALAVECRAPDAAHGDFDQEIREALEGLHDPATSLAVYAERAILERSQAGCSAPIGALASIDGTALTLAAVMADDEGRLSRLSTIATLPDEVTDNMVELSRGIQSESRRIARELGYRTADELLSTLGAVPGTASGANAPETNLVMTPGGDRDQR